MILNLNAQIIWVFVNLLVLFLLMKKFLFGPVTKMLDERAQGVSDTIDQAESRLADAEQSKAESDRQLAQAQDASLPLPSNAGRENTSDALPRPSRPSSGSMRRLRSSVKQTALPCWQMPKSRSRRWCC